jgi:TRAP-type C4-dicarboxylate transport system permease small subunit
MMKASKPSEISGLGVYARVLRTVIYSLCGVAAVSIVLMIAITCRDVIGRRVFNVPMRGAYDLVSALAAITLAASLPYTTGLKGHVAIEFLFLKLSKRGRRIGNILVHTAIALLFVFFTWQCVQYGLDLLAKHQGMVTLRWPLFWVPFLMAFCCGVTTLVVFEQIVHPDRELVKP